MKRKHNLPRNIYKYGKDGYIIKKDINGEHREYGTFKKIDEALKRLEELKPIWEEEIVNTPVSIHPYQNIYPIPGSATFKVFKTFKNKKKKGFSKNVNNIWTALYLRDLGYKHEWDKKRMFEEYNNTDNPYLLQDLPYPYPDNLRWRIEYNLFHRIDLLQSECDLI